MIFKQGSCEQELFDGMQSAQQESLIEEAQQQDRLVFAAMQALNNAAESFERIGRSARAEEVTAVMVSLADGENNVDVLSKNASNNEVLKVFEFFGFNPNELGFSE
jgi:hypothetical protein